MATDTDPAIELGRRVRAGRLALRLTQDDLAAAVGVDRSLISRLELGHGGAIALERWLIALDAVGLRFDIAATGRGPIDRDAPCRRVLAELATKGGWASEELTVETMLIRGEDRVIVRVWDPVTVVPDEIRSLKAAMDRERANGLVVIPATGANRRRVSECRADLREVFPVPGNRWYVALVSRRSMPDGPGILWAHPDCRGLRVAGNLPGWIWAKIGDGPRFATGRRARR